MVNRPHRVSCPPTQHPGWTHGGVSVVFQDIHITHCGENPSGRPWCNWYSTLGVKQVWKDCNTAEVQGLTLTKTSTSENVLICCKVRQKHPDTDRWLALIHIPTSTDVPEVFMGLFWRFLSTETPGSSSESLESQDKRKRDDQNKKCWQR